MSAMEGFLKWTVTCSMVVLCSVQASNILVIPPTTYSHCAEISSVGQALVDRGHNVSVLLSSAFTHRNCYIRGIKKMTVIWLHPVGAIEPTENMTRAVTKAMLGGEKLSFFQHIDTMKRIVDSVCGNLLSNKEAIAALQEDHYDLIILNGAFIIYCSFVIPYYLHTPYVSVSTVIEDFVSGRPFLPSISPALFSASTDSMTFFQRLKNAFSVIAFHVMAQYLIPMDRVAFLAPELSRQDVVNLVAKSELFLYNYDPVLAYPLPKMPNHEFIGGIGIQKASPLPGELEQYYRDSAYGVILVTFGGNAMDLPESKVENLMSVFHRLKFNVLWKYETDSQNGNVKQMKWVPQNDLLAHPNTKLFLSHCGNAGVFEALYHGVPIVCTPIMTDQFFNGARVQHWEVGVSVPLLESSADAIYSAILNVLNDPKYRKNMRRASEMYRSRPDTPRERAASAVEHVLRFGGEHLRSRASDMSVFTYMGYDILCFLFVVVLSATLVLFKCFRLFRGYCRKTRKKEKVH